MNRIFPFAFFLLCCFLIEAQKYEPITAKEVSIIDTFHNHYYVEDKYRWLEDIDSEATKEWLAEQDRLADKYLSKCSDKTNSLRAIEKYAFIQYDYVRKEGNYYFKYAYSSSSKTPALFYQTSLKSNPRILVDPEDISMKDKIVLGRFSVSKDSKLLAYQFSRNGSDWAEVKVVSLKGGKHKKDHLKGLKFSNIAWRGDGFFYSTFSQENQFGKTIEQKVFYHKIGTEQQADQLVFQRKSDPSGFSVYQTSSDERFFILKETDEQTGRTNIFYIDYQSDQPALKPLLYKLEHDLNILDSHDGKFIAVSTYQSDNGMIVEIDPANPHKWRAIASEYSDALLLNVIPFSDRIIAVYQVDQHPFITVLDYSGAVLHNLEMPVATSVGGFSGGGYDEELLFYYQSYTKPPIVYKFNIKTFEKKPNDYTKVNFDFKNIVYEEVEYPAKDGVLVPMILVYEKKLKQDGKNPAILKAYGGFGIPARPSFDAGIIHFIKEGGVFAFANIRGGGDKGKEWARAGKGKYKQRSFDDFIAAAEFLIENKYTSKERLAITGGSNGGLVVAAAAIQRPELFKVVVPRVAPLDMLRFEKFTVGHWHVEEYGTVKDSLSFTRLFGYSPYHNIADTVNYPATLVITSENDDRVPPFHSYKFVARLQSRNAQKNPVILKVEKQSGHYGAPTRHSRIKAKADLYGFILNELMK